MKIVHLETGRHVYGGALQVLLLVEGLVRHGVENLLVVPDGSAVGEAARSKGLPVRSLPMAGEADLVFPFRFRRLLRDEAPDLVHLHSRRGADTLGAITARLAGVPTVLSRRVDNPEAGWSLGAKYRLFDAVITISEGIRRVLLDQGVPPEKVRCVRSALNPRPFEGPCRRQEFRGAFALEDGARAVGMAAQLIPRKGHDTLLRAVPAILRAHPETRFLLFGRGSLEGGIRATVERMGLQDAVVLAGFRDDLPTFLPCLDLLVHPADMEGLGIVLLQASASGIPVVASAVGGIPEAVVHEENGLLVAPGNAEALAKAVVALLGDPERSRAMGEAGRKRVQDLFSVEGMVEGNLAVYREVLGA